VAGVGHPRDLGEQDRELVPGQAGHGVDVGASIGVALYPQHGDEAELLVQRADVAMYAAKRVRHSYEVYSAEHDSFSPERLALLGELRRGIGAGELVMHYQPKADLATGAVCGVEALVRWQHPVRGLVPPDQFIPLAESAGLMPALTSSVLDQALRQCRTWRDAGLGLTVAVNLSVRSLHDLGFPDEVARLLATWAVPASALELEITETAIMAEPARAMNVLTALSHMGISLAIDDFGTGYSSLAYLKRLPVDTIKIDRSFVKDMTEDEEDGVIVRSTIDLGRNLGLQVVAEGVESEATWQRLRTEGCHLAQGYYLGRPLPADELTAWLTARRTPELL
jgi:EAL domain-containing protein (putative c-di-GMP-specific phosphodiesterase class I)